MTHELGRMFGDLGFQIAWGNVVVGFNLGDLGQQIGKRRGQRLVGLGKGGFALEEEVGQVGSRKETLEDRIPIDKEVK